MEKKGDLEIAEEGLENSLVYDQLPSPMMQGLLRGEKKG